MTDQSDFNPQPVCNEGWFQPARRCPSPNFNSRPAGVQPSLLVVHNISLPPGKFGTGHIHEFFCNQLDPEGHPYFAEIAGMKVSAHCLIERDGGVTQFVSFDDRAWHAGRSNFQGEEECNDFGVGVELEGTDTLEYTGPQYESLACLAAALMRAYPAITPERMAGHCDVAPGRKSDPGPAFDWGHFRQLLSRHL